MRLDAGVAVLEGEAPVPAWSSPRAAVPHPYLWRVST